MPTNRADGAAPAGMERALAGNEAPPFWYEPAGLQARLLAPAAAVYGFMARRRLDREDVPHVPVPVLCVGNLTVGGTGKTPVALALAGAALAAGHRPGFVSRGYGGSHVRPHLVDLAHDTARSVGDEPLLLARMAPTVIAANRHAAAMRLVDDGATFVIMDDGFQSRSLGYDLALVVLDMKRGIGNGHVIPAGPLRAPLRDQLRRSDRLLAVGDGNAGDAVIRAAARAGKPCMQARLVPEVPPAIVNRELLAFSGIGDPEKFHDTLTAAGLHLSAVRTFGDHHAYTVADAEMLLAKAKGEGLTLVTTAKDHVRLSHTEGPLAALREQSHVLPVTMVFDPPSAAGELVEAAERRYEERRLRER